MAKTIFLIALISTAAMAAAKESLDLKMTRAAGADLDAWHFRTGVPFGEGQLSDRDGVRLFRGDEEIAAQAEVMATWGPPNSGAGASVKWLGLDFVDRVRAGVSNEYRLVVGKRANARREIAAARKWLAWLGVGKPAAVRQPPGLEADEQADRITIKNGRLELVCNKGGSKGFNLFESVRVDGREMIAPGGPRGAYIDDGEGRRYWAQHDLKPDVRVEMQGPVAAVIRAEGWFVNPDAGDTAAVEGEPVARPAGGFCRYITRVYVGAHEPCVRVQHTFVLTEDSGKTTYRDIGLVLPTGSDAREAAFGGVATNQAGHSWLLQKNCDSYSVMAPGEGGEVLETAVGQKAEGWLSAGGLAVAVKDFWQNYPKELEFYPAQSRMIVHFWPAHGAPRHETAATVSAANGWRLPFVHSGRTLDFTIPAVFLDTGIFGKEYGYLGSSQSVEEGLKANALGIAKTHELLIAFADRSFPARQKMFQQSPHILADPKHIAGTRVLGRIAASDPAAFPEAEARINRGMKFYLRMLDRAKAYGMWNYGDVNHKWITRNGEWGPSYYRLWGGFHHGKPRLPWWLYLRNGDPDFLDFGRAQALHNGDIDLCHWSNAEAARGAPNSNRKMVGGLCDYKGFVHWHAGDRSGYNSMIDPLLYDYYLTGNRRSRDVALEHGRYVLSVRNTDRGGRSAAGQADTLVNLYMATWDPKVATGMVAAVTDLMARPPYKQHAPDWTPWLWRYWELTKDPAARDYIVRWADLGFLEREGGPEYKAIRAATVAAKEPFYGVFGEDGLDLTAYAYYITGNPKYASFCRERVRYRGGFTYLKEGDPLDGWNGSDWYEWAFSIRDSMIALEAAQAGRPTRFDDLSRPSLSIITPRLDNASGRRILGADYPMPAGAAQQRLVTMFYHDGTPCRIPLGSRSQYKPVVTRLYEPAGKLIREFATTNRDAKVEEVALGAENGKGFYALTHESEGSFAPVLPSSDKCWMRVGPGVTWCLGRGRAFFYVPPHAAEFELRFAPGYPVSPTQYRFMAAGTLYDPAGRVAARIAAGNDPKPQVIAVKAAPEHRGRVWHFVGNDYVLLVNVRGIAPWISASPGAFAEPNRMPPDALPEWMPKAK